MNIRSIYSSIIDIVLSIIYYSQSPLKLFDSRTRRGSPDTASRRGSPKTASRRCSPETALCDDFTCYLWQVDGYSRFSSSKKFYLNTPKGHEKPFIEGGQTTIAKRKFTKRQTMIDTTLDWKLHEPNYKSGVNKICCNGLAVSDLHVSTLSFRCVSRVKNPVICH
jgi:hypothetical protein